MSTSKRKQTSVNVMLIPHFRLESLTQVERCGELKMFLLDMWRHVPPSVLPTSLSFPCQISTQINEKSNSPNLRMYTFCQVSLMKTVIYTNMISQRNPAGHTGITVVTTDGEVHMFHSVLKIHINWFCTSNVFCLSGFSGIFCSHRTVDKYDR